jgi:formate-dependent nitrite reductase membrane component NrfD
MTVQPGERKIKRGASRSFSIYLLVILLFKIIKLDLVQQRWVDDSFILKIYDKIIKLKNNE